MEGKILIIAEKPSLCKNIVGAIGGMKWVAGKAKNSGYYENDRYVASYAFGHLFSLFDMQDYDENLKPWKEEDLPYFPDKFRYKLKSDDVKGQYALLKSLIGRKDVTAIANAGDSDREGEIIVRNILRYAENKKPVYRLWLPDQTPKTINDELRSMKKDDDYDNLANEGYARTFADWLYGINLTRIATIKSGQLLRVGRVTTPIVSAICERERAIRNFVPQKYYVATHSADGLKLTSKVKNDKKQDCDAQCDRYNRLETVVQDRTSAKKTVTRPRLLSLSDLQGIAGKTLKMSPKDTLDTLQKLYEAGYTSYPRTDSEYMAEAEKGKAKDIIAAIKKAIPSTFDGISFRDSKAVFDDSKIEAHSAITPTYKIPASGALSGREKDIYDIILRRFAAVFCTEEYVLDRTTLVISNGEETFRINGDVIVTKGYTAYEPDSRKSDTASLLPPLKKGDRIRPAFCAEEKETTPPPHYTADSLNAYLKNPYSKQEQKELAEDDIDSETVETASEVQLGTEATRAGLIDAAIRSGYILLEKNQYGITPAGEYYCDSLTRLGINMAKDRTLNLSRILKLVYRNQKTMMDVVRESKDDLTATIAGARTAQTVPGERKGGNGTMGANTNETALCACPKCKQGQIVEKDKLYGCTDRNCGCALWKDDHFLTKFQKKMTKTIALSFFKKGYADISGLVSAKTGREFNARIYVDFSDKYPKYTFNFDEYDGKSKDKKNA